MARRRQAFKPKDARPRDWHGRFTSKLSDEEKIQNREWNKALMMTFSRGKVNGVECNIFRPFREETVAYKLANEKGKNYHALALIITVFTALIYIISVLFAFNPGIKGAFHSGFVLSGIILSIVYLVVKSMLESADEWNELAQKELEKG